MQRASVRLVTGRASPCLARHPPHPPGPRIACPRRRLPPGNHHSRHRGVGGQRGRRGPNQVTSASPPHYDDTSLKLSTDLRPRVIQQEPISPTRRPLTVTIGLRACRVSSCRALASSPWTRASARGVAQAEQRALSFSTGVLERHSGEAVRIVAYKTVHGQVVGEPVATHELTLNDNGFEHSSDDPMSIRLTRMMRGIPRPVP